VCGATGDRSGELDPGKPLASLEHSTPLNGFKGGVRECVPFPAIVSATLAASQQLAAAST
jgi:hypothetical protein